MKNVSVWSWSRLEPPFLAGAGSDPIWLKLERESAPGPQTSGAGAAQKVAAPQHCKRGSDPPQLHLLCTSLMNILLAP